METSATTPHKKSAIVIVRQLSPALGAEILGVDLRDPINDALKQKFLHAWHQHLVILLRNQTLDERHSGALCRDVRSAGENPLRTHIQRKTSVRDADLEHPR